MGLDGRYFLLYGIVGLIMLDNSASKHVNGARFYPRARIYHRSMRTWNSLSYTIVSRGDTTNYGYTNVLVTSLYWLLLKLNLAPYQLRNSFHFVITIPRQLFIKSSKPKEFVPVGGSGGKILHSLTWKRVRCTWHVHFLSMSSNEVSRWSLFHK